MKVPKTEVAYEELRQKYELGIDFSFKQNSLFQRQERVVLDHDQMDDLVNQIASQYGMASFLERNAFEIQSIVASLYVLNYDLWRIMEKKPWDKETMLAMATIPYCFWDQNEESASNPKAVNRWELRPSTLVFKSNPLTLSISGDGGNFCGYIEQSMITSRKFGLPEPRRLIPNYQFAKVQITAELSRAGIRIHPPPMNDLDYDFSAAAKEFYDHGVHLTIPGEHVALEVEKRKPANLRGEVHLLMAAIPSDEHGDFKALLGDIWFWTLHRLLESTE